MSVKSAWLPEVMKMIQERLLRSRSWIVAIFLVAGIVVSMTSAFPEPAIGLTLEWESIGSDVEINYVRTEGGRNKREDNITITKRSPMHYALMSGDVDEIPKWMQIEWQYGIVEAKTFEEAHRYAKHAKAYIDLKALIPPAYIEEVARDRHRKQLKLTGTFKDDKLSVRADVYQWRD